MHRGALIGMLLATSLAHADDLARCQRGVDVAAKNDLPRAMLLLTGCDQAELPDDVGPAIRATLRETKKRVKAAELAELAIVSDPAGVPFELEALAGEALVAPVTVFLPAGTHTITYRRGTQVMRKDAVTEKYSRSAVILDAVEPAKKEPRTGHVSFEEEGEIEQHAGPPPDVKRGSMMDPRYLRKPGARSGSELDDPLAINPQRGAPPWIGVRLGGGIHDDSATSAAWRPTIAGTLRVRLQPRLFLAGRLDWSRRGGSSPDAIDTVALNAGAGYTLLATRTLQLAAIGQIRSELRFADTRDAMDIPRLGAGAAAGLELAFPTTPLTVGLRAEHAITELVPGIRDRALLLELGVDWR